MNIKLLAFLMLLAGHATAQIQSLTGPSITCPDVTNSFTVNYVTYPTGPGYTESVCQIRWTFSRNGTVFSTQYSSSYPTVAFPTPRSASMTAPTLLTGSVRVEVRITVCYAQNGFPGIKYHTRSMDTFVGLSPVSSVSGPSFLCPGGTGTYTASAVPNATSYKWEVPSYWQVNGINGPVVTTSSRTATISVPSCDNTAFHRTYPAPTAGIVKVSPVSGTCGTGGSASMNVFIDYQTTLEAVENNDGTTTFQLNYDYFPEYGWNSPLPEGWQLVSKEGYRMTVNTNQIPGPVSLEFRTSCGCVYGLSMFWSPPEPPPPPPPCCEEVIQAFPIPARNTLHVRVPKSASVQVFVDGKPVFVPLPSGTIQLDISDLSTGPHILVVREASRRSRTIRFVKAGNQ